MKRPAIFLDRDGTLIREVPFAFRREDLHLLPNVGPGLRRLAAMGFQLVIITNQSGIARGYFSEDDMHAFHQALCEDLRAEGVEIAAIYYCPFHPTEGIGPYRRPSSLRKPRPGMLLRAAAQHELDLAASFMIGDRESDVLAGQAAGCRTILIRSDAGANVSEPLALGDYVAGDLLAAARLIEAAKPSTIHIPLAAKGSCVAPPAALEET